MKLKYLLSSIAFVCFASCDYEKVNSNIYGVSDEEMKQGGLLYGTSFQEMQQSVIPIGSPTLVTDPGNRLQNTDLISSGNYIGYWGNNNYWSPLNEAQWNFSDDRMDYAYQNFYSNLFRAWNNIYKEVKASNEPYDLQVASVANIVKITGWLRATDVFGPLVYTNAGNGDIAPKLDSQEKVYKAMLEDLAKASAILRENPSNVLTDYDVIYGGNAASWVRFANSLMLRMAVRVRYKDESLARTYIEMALNPENGGVIEDKSQEAKIQNSDKMPLMNSMLPSVNDYNETRMGTTIYAYLNGYDDPRLSAYFNKGSYNGRENYLAVVPTNKKPKGEGIKSAEYASKPKVETNAPLYWMRASEVYFLKAEAALCGLLPSEDAQSLYEFGVRMSFEENGVSGVDEYLKGTGKPDDIRSMDNMYDMSYSCIISSGNTSPNWEDCTSGNKDQKEEQLQKIITQKYLALYPNAVEAWTEYRRTGYPYIMKPADSGAPARIAASDDCLAPERFRFAPSEYTTNPNMNEVPALLGGDDQGATKLWWVRSDRPIQPTK